MKKYINFDYFNIGDFQSIGGEFVIDIPAGINSKTNLLTAIAEAGGFPAYFGGNWDALEECLRDLSWIKEEKVIVLHRDIPLQSNPRDCRIYLEILRDVLNDWDSKSNEYHSSPDGEFFDHEVRVAFPSIFEDDVMKLIR